MASRPTATPAWDTSTAAEARSRRRNKIDASRLKLAEEAAAAAAAAAVAATPRSDSNTSNSAQQQEHYGDGSKETRLQARKVKNREAAMLSRKRKSDRVGELMIQVDKYKEENQQLRQHAAHSQRGGGGTTNSTGNTEEGEDPPPPVLRNNILARRPSASNGVPPVTSASTRVFSSAPATFSGLFSVNGGMLHGHPQAPCSRGGGLPQDYRQHTAAGPLVPGPPPSVMGQGWGERGGGGGSAAAVGRDGGVGLEGRTHRDGARPFFGGSGEVDETLDRLFHELMTED